MMERVAMKWHVTSHGERLLTGMLTVGGDYELHMLRLGHMVTYPPGSKLKGFTGHSWYVRD
jgi:hypothetical protein